LIRVIAKSYAKSEHLDQLLRLSEEMVRETVKEQGCISYELFQDVKEPNVLVILEEWADEQALEKHMGSEHFTRIIPQMNELREKPSEVNICKKIF